MAEAVKGRYLSEELQEKILLLLPIKSIVRFESVAKSWQSTFHSRRFIALFGPRYPDRDPRTIRQSPSIYSAAPGLVERVRKPGRLKIRVLGPLSNGIYCLTSHNRYQSRYYRFHYRFKTAAISSAKIALCNPAIRSHKLIDPFPAEFHSLLSHVSSNSKPCRVHFGFGCVENNNHIESYNVVVLVNYDGDGRARLQMERRPRPTYSSFLVFVYNYKVQRGGGKWKKIVDYDPGRRNVGRVKATEAFTGSITQRRIIDIAKPLEVCPQKFFEGCFHWMGVGEDRSYVVLSYNLVKESFKLIGVPQHRGRGDVFVLHDHLVVIKILEASFPAQCYEVNVWMMMKYGVEESWTRIYTIRPDKLYVKISRIYGVDYCPLQSEIGGIRIKRIWFEDGFKKKIISFKDGGDGHKVVGSSKDVSYYCWNTSGISTYVETLERF